WRSARAWISTPAGAAATDGRARGLVTSAFLRSGKGRAFRARSMSFSLGHSGAAGWLLGGCKASSSRRIPSSECTGTAVRFREELIGEVFAGDGKLLSRSPDHRAAAERLAALAGVLLGIRDGVDHLHLVLRLVHDGLHGVAAKIGRAGTGPGDELA